jgi:hypothetical protein
MPTAPPLCRSSENLIALRKICCAVTVSGAYTAARIAPFSTNRPVSATASDSTQPENRAFTEASPASFDVTNPTVRMDCPSGSRAAGAVLSPMSWIRSTVSSTSPSPGSSSAAARAGSRGTSFMPQSGQRARGSLVTKAGCMGQVYPAPGPGSAVDATAGCSGAEADASPATGTRSMPQIGHSPPRLATIEGCIGQ